MTRSVVFRVDEDLLLRFDAFARRARVSRSEALRLYMARAVSQQADLFASLLPDLDAEGSLRRQDRAG